MDAPDKDLLIARIASGTVRLSLPGGVNLVVRQPSREGRYVAQEIYQKVLRESRLDGCHDQASLLAFLFEKKLWDDQRQKELDGVKKDIEEFKVGLVTLAFRTYERKKTKLCLAKAKEREAALLAERHAYDHLSCEGGAAAARTRYLVGASLHWPGGTRVFPDETLWEGAAEGDTLDKAVEAYIENRIEEPALREVARTEPWRSVWGSRTACGSLFGCPAADCTDEQTRLVAWTALYDNIHQHPECPADEVLEDDDACDGWLILQGRKRKEAATRTAADAAVGNPKIAASEEVFIVAETPEDARRIHDLNDARGAAVRRQRERQIGEGGSVDHMRLADVRAEVQMGATQNMVKGRKNG